MSDDRSLTQRALDLIVYVPAGLALTVAEDLPQLAERGRTQIEGQVRNAKVVGQLVVNLGQRELRRRFASTEAPPSATTPSPTTTTPPSATPSPATPPPATPSPATPSRPATASRPSPTPAVGLAIPDYDTLSASQVVRRLDGLGRAELEAIYDHEAGDRHRRTILHRIQQLLDLPEAPGPGA